MSLVVTIQATKHARWLEQIHNVVITNVTDQDQSPDRYSITLDGTTIDLIEHDREDGALVLVEAALRRINSGRRSQELVELLREVRDALGGQ